MQKTISNILVSGFIVMQGLNMGVAENSPVRAPVLEAREYSITPPKQPQTAILSEKQALEDDIPTLIARYFPENPEMLEIAIAESEMDTTAYNPEWHYDKNGNRVCQGSYGLFQIACVNYEGDYKDLYDIETNIKVAKQVLETQGFRAWGVCKDGKVKCH